MSDEVVSSGDQLNRRELGKLALGAAVGAAVLGWPQSSSAADVASSAPSGIKLGTGGTANPTDEDLLYLTQMGWDTVSVGGLTPDQQNDADLMKSIMKRYADVGIRVDQFSNALQHPPVEVYLNRPGRDETIETYKKWIRALGKAGITFTRWDWIRFQDVKSGETKTRGAVTRDFDQSSSTMVVAAGALGPGSQADSGPANKLVFGREYGREEMTENYKYFMKQIAPVAEEAGVRIGWHPDDPPMPSLFGVARIFNNLEACKERLAEANSPNVGMNLCCGTWAEGGAAMGTDCAGALRYFGSRKQLFGVHFRNVSSPLPHFNEAFPDNGYYDQYKIMKALADVKFPYTVQLDHSQAVVGGIRVYNAFALGYMKALRQVARSGNTA